VSESALCLVRGGGHVMACEEECGRRRGGGWGGLDGSEATTQNVAAVRRRPMSTNLLPLFLSFWKAHQR